MPSSFKEMIPGKRQELESAERKINNALLYLRAHLTDVGAGEAEADLNWAQIFLRRAIRTVGGKTT